MQTSSKQEDPLENKTLLVSYERTVETAHMVCFHGKLEPDGKDEWIGFDVPRTRATDAVVREAKRRISDHPPLIMKCLPKVQWELVVPPWSGPREITPKSSIDVIKCKDFNDPAEVAAYRFGLRMIFRENSEESSSECPVPPPKNWGDVSEVQRFYSAVRKFFKENQNAAEAENENFLKGLEGRLNAVEEEG